MEKENGGSPKVRRDDPERPIPGIVITDGRSRRDRARERPLIAAFVWGGKVRPSPTLPFGRWKGAA